MLTYVFIWLQVFPGAGLSLRGSMFIYDGNEISSVFIEAYLSCNTYTYVQMSLALPHPFIRVLWRHLIKDLDQSSRNDMIFHILVRRNPWGLIIDKETSIGTKT